MWPSIINANKSNNNSFKKYCIKKLSTGNLYIILQRGGTRLVQCTLAMLNILICIMYITYIMRIYQFMYTLINIL